MIDTAIEPIDGPELARIFASIFTCIQKYRNCISFVNLTDEAGHDAKGDLAIYSEERKR